MAGSPEANSALSQTPQEGRDLGFDAGFWVQRGLRAKLWGGLLDLQASISSRRAWRCVAGMLMLPCYIL